MSRVRYGDLTWAEKRRLEELGVTNGCGPKYGIVNWLVPDVLFGLRITEDCNHHDFNYWLGGKPADRLKADYQLYERILERAWEKTKPWWRRWLRPIYYAAARTYYIAVRIGGAQGDLWWRGPTRTREDIDALLASGRA